jgi:putative endonuclease
MSEPSDWIVYILECADQTLYTGITNDLDHRINEHENGRGAKYTRGRAPFTLLYTETHSSRSQALKREAKIKSFDRATKLQLALAVHGRPEGQAQRPVPARALYDCGN